VYVTNFGRATLDRNTFAGNTAAGGTGGADAGGGNATGGAVYDGRKCAEALHLVQVAEASVPELTNDPEMAQKLNRSKIAIRYQQAEKDFRTAEYYERTGHAGSAIFYYELTRRRYPNTRYSEIAANRKEQLKGIVDSGKPLTGRDPIVILQAKWKEVFGSKKAVVTADGEEPTGPTGPTGPTAALVPVLSHAVIAHGARALPVLGFMAGRKVTGD